MLALTIISILLSTLDVIGQVAYDKEQSKIKKSLLDIRSSIQAKRAVNNAEMTKINNYIEYVKTLSQQVDPRIWDKISGKLSNLQQKSASITANSDSLDQKLVEAETLADQNRPTGISKTIQMADKVLTGQDHNTAQDAVQDDISKLETIAKEVK